MRGRLSLPQPGRRRIRPGNAGGTALVAPAHSLHWYHGDGIGGTSSILALGEARPGQAPVSPCDGGRIRRADSDDLRNRRAGGLPRPPRGARRGAADPPGRPAGLQAGDRGDVAGRLRQEDGAEGGRPAVHEGAARRILFYAGIVSAGFDICDAPAGIVVNHAERAGAHHAAAAAHPVDRHPALRDHQRGVGVPERDLARGSQPLVQRGARRRWSGARWRRARSTARRFTPRSCSRRSSRVTATRW